MARFEYDYYSGAESGQFRFLRVPKIFFEDPDYEELGSDEKILYGFLHEQVDMSQKNGWVDEEGRTYVIRTLESIQKILHNCSPDKARATLKNLIDYGLVEKKRRGQGKPDLIYVKNFITKKSEISISEKRENNVNDISENEKNHFLKPEKPPSKNGKFRILESGKTGAINNNNKYTKEKENPSISQDDRLSDTFAPDGSMDGSSEGEIEHKAYEELIKENLEYDTRIHDLKLSDERQLFDDFYSLILEIVTGNTREYRINGSDIPQPLVKSRMLKLKGDDIYMAIQQLKSVTGRIRNIRSYMIAILYNAPVTTNAYITNDIRQGYQAAGSGKEGMS